MTTLVTSRPVRSLATVLAAWIVLRVMVVASEDRVPVVPVSATAAIANNIVQRAKGPSPESPLAATLKRADTAITRLGWTAAPRDLIRPGGRHRPSQAIGRPVEIASATLPEPEKNTDRLPIRVAIRDAQPVPPPLETLSADKASPVNDVSLSTAALTRRIASWSGSAWILARRDSALALGQAGSQAGQLGGSQAGARLYYRLNPVISLTGRISAPLGQSRGAESSVGLAIRHKNVGVLLERRIALDSGARDAFSATVFGGFSNVALPGGIQLDGYGQAGIVGRDAFVDGAVRGERTIVTSGKARLAIGAGIWGGAQPGVQRVDIGPQVVAILPFEGRAARLSAEWRQRIAGKAAPSSGPSVTLGFDF